MKKKPQNGLRIYAHCGHSEDSVVLYALNLVSSAILSLIPEFFFDHFFLYRRIKRTGFLSKYPNWNQFAHMSSLQKVLQQKD